ncbi:DUF2752 domain-containing protein [Pedobacter sp. GR22-6]|uniref:DUF2752 domain-containing protein n=1 Tax=Pedobacter sp. GR22-6 TaxID=3127957 RepID=UPI00307CEF2E
MFVCVTYLLSVWSSFLDRTDNFLIPCPFKYLTGLDCPGCGFQRSFILLIKGEWLESFHMYPPTIFILLTVFTVLFVRYGLKKKNDRLIKVLYLITGSVIVSSYLLKMFLPHIH